MSKSAEEIAGMYAHRLGRLSTPHQEMVAIERAYSGGLKIALPEMDEVERPAVANILRLGIRGHAQRVASVAPVIKAPSLRPGFKYADERADDRRRAVMGWRRMNNDARKRRRRALHLTAYGQTPVSISAIPEGNDPRHIPFWRVRNPLSTFPSEMSDPDNVEPDDCIFVDRRERRWLEDQFPAPMMSLRKGNLREFDVLEYVDAYETTLVVVGATAEESSQSRGYGQRPQISGGAPYMVLATAPNRTGICPVVVPGTVDIDGCVSRFSGLIGMYEKSAKLDAMLWIATVREVFGEGWLESIPSVPGTPTIVQEADGALGILGIVKNGRINFRQAIQNQPAQMALDSLERSQRLDGGVPAEWGGESGSNIRTARRGADVQSAATDMPIQEDQEVLELSYEAEHRRGIAVMKTYWGKQPSMFFIPSNGTMSRADYVPDDAFDTDDVYAVFPIPGADKSAQTVIAGQKVGAGIWPARLAMELDDSIDDVEENIRAIQIESLNRAALQQLEAQPIDPVKLGYIIRELATGQTLAESLIEADQKVQAKQAAAQQGQPGPDDGQPANEAVQPGLDESPEAAALAKQTALGQTSGVAGGATEPPPSAGASDIMKMLQAAHPPAPAAVGAA